MSRRLRPPSARRRMAARPTTARRVNRSNQQSLQASHIPVGDLSDMTRLHSALCAALASVVWATISVAQTAAQRPAPQTPTSSQTTWVPDGSDKVIVEFSKGSMPAPVVTGPLWNGSQRPPTQQSSGSREAPTKVVKRGIAPVTRAQTGASASPAKAHSRTASHRKSITKPTAPPAQAQTQTPAK